MSMPWFRLYSEFASDPIIQSLAFEDQRHFVVILCLKCTGLLDRKILPNKRNIIIARALGLDIVSFEEAQRRLIEVNLIDNKWQPIKWDARQYLSDNSTKRVRKYRKNKETGNVSETLQGRYGNAPDTDTDTDTDKDNNTTRENGVSTKVPFEKIKEKWNVMAVKVGLPQCEKLTNTIKGQIRARWNEDLKALKNWDNYFKYIENNKFLTGRKEPGPGRTTPMRAKLWWVTKESNFAKIASKEYE